MRKNKYKYDGPVMQFGRCISNKWIGITYAESEAKAKNNLSYQFKKIAGLMPESNISLPNNLVIIE